MNVGHLGQKYDVLQKVWPLASLISSGIRFWEIIFFQGCKFSAKSYFFRDNYFPCFYQNNGFSLTIRDWFPLSILITLCLYTFYTSVHRCILWTRDLALVLQRELTFTSDIPQGKSKRNHFSFISIWFPKIASMKKYGGNFWSPLKSVAQGNPQSGGQFRQALLLWQESGVPDPKRLRQFHQGRTTLVKLPKPFGIWNTGFLPQQRRLPKMSTRLRMTFTGQSMGCSAASRRMRWSRSCNGCFWIGDSGHDTELNVIAERGNVFPAEDHVKIYAWGSFSV